MGDRGSWSRAHGVAWASALLVACSGGVSSTASRFDAGSRPRDAGDHDRDAGTPDGGSVDGGHVDAGREPAADAGVPFDAGTFPDDPFGPEPKVTVVEAGIGHVEGPTWIPEEGFVYHVRGGIHRIYRFDSRETALWYDLPGGNHGSHHSEGYVYLANRRPAEIARIEVATLRYESLPVRLGRQTLALPNDIDRFEDGTLYFSDWGGADVPPNYIGYGVYRRMDDGELINVIDDLERPNGVAFSADCRSLFVTDNPTLFRWDVAIDGSLSNASAGDHPGPT